jgi:NAD(P)-dependent dehydrogenase (short-subunit alcohol dehydrogenase family)
MRSLLCQAGAAARPSRRCAGDGRQRGGRIVNFGSKAGCFGSLSAGASGAAAKGAMAAVTRQLAREFGPQGISVDSAQAMA